MKQCPTCNRTYSDDGQSFCLDDGTPLVTSYDSEATHVMNPPPRDPMAPSLPQHSPTLTGRASGRHTNTALYVAIALLALLVGGALVALLKSEPKNGSTSQSSTPTSNPTPEQSSKSTAKPTVNQPESQTVKIDSRTMWVDTGVTLSQGETLEIQASGLWANSGDNPKAYGPNGLNNSWPGTLLESANNGSLIGRVGGVIFAVGANYSGRSPSSGRLYLSMNDVPGTYSDNSGSVIARVSHYRN